MTDTRTRGGGCTWSGAAVLVSVPVPPLCTARCSRLPPAAAPAISIGNRARKQAKSARKLEINVDGRIQNHWHWHKYEHALFDGIFRHFSSSNRTICNDKYKKKLTADELERQNSIGGQCCQMKI